MPTLSAGLDYVDLMFLGRPQIIAAALLHSVSGVAIVDPGPAITLPASSRSSSAAACRWPTCARYCSPTSISTMPARRDRSWRATRRSKSTCTSAARRTWSIRRSSSRALAACTAIRWTRCGENSSPFPRTSAHVMKGGERVAAVGRQLDVAYTPGHASHHVVYLDRSSGVAFAGDTAGIRRGPHPYMMPPTPPPDIDLSRLARERRSDARLASSHALRHPLRAV